MDTSIQELHSKTSIPRAPAAAAPGAGRYDIYAGIHKALRLFMSRTLCEVGSTDPGNADEVAPRSACWIACSACANCT